MPANLRADDIGQNGLSVFASTADQRYLLSPELFLRTHYPVTMRRFQNGHSIAVTEANLLDQVLKNPTGIVGNRVYILYAAPGSGKSEMMRWLQAQIERQSPIRAETTIRISRTELDALSIAERFKHLLSAEYFSELTHQRWAAARRKPRTLSKLLVLSTLENLLNSDDEINALYYRLLNAAQPYIERSLGLASGDADAPAELISREEWEAIRAETSLSIPLDYEQFRRQMLSFFHRHLLEGLDLVNTLRRISSNVMQTRGVRPILLVDDLVQSLNLFATDLLDYFMTLEEGNWDVVLGLTPAAFESSQRGRELLQRIAHLDTIDDRVEKLWLSDEIGRESYVLNEATCHHFAARYLAEYHRLRNVSAENELYPFNREALVRIFRGLPANKGKTRYFLRHLREILAQTAAGTPLPEAIAPYARTEFVARTGDPTLAAVCELYGPLVTEETPGVVALSDEAAAQFNLSPKALTVPVEPLIKLKFSREAISEMVDDEEKAAIRDWLLGKEVNRQLLKRVRQGAARWLRAIQPPGRLHADHIPRPNGVLWYRQTYLGVNPPILLEGVDDEAGGIRLPRDIGLNAFDLHHYAAAKGANLKSLTARLAVEPVLAQLLLSGLRWREQIMTQLATQLEIPVPRFVLLLYTLWIAIERPAEHPLQQFTPALSADLARRRQKLLDAPTPFTPTLVKSIQQLFDDFFRLRENMYDGPRIAALLSGESAESLLAMLERLDITRIDANYRLGRQLLVNVLETIQELIQGWQGKAPKAKTLSAAAQKTLNALRDDKRRGVPLSQTPLSVWAELQEKEPELFAALQVVKSSDGG